MCIERVVLCGGAPPGSLPCADPKPLVLLRSGPLANIDLKIGDVSAALWGPVGRLFLDLIDIATYVYVADQAVRRGGDCDWNYGEEWRRRLCFRIAVREPDFWQETACPPLIETLSFLSEDEYHFDFVPLAKEPPLDAYFENPGDPFDGRVEEVVLFSGGIDSTGGVIREAMVDRRKIVMVNHRSTLKLAARQRHLVEELRRKAADVKPIFVPVRINKAKKLTRDYLQRTRSFLYASLAATIAAALQRDRIRFYENGVVSLNLPPAAQFVGARASRTTHPRVLRGFEKIFSAVVGRPFRVENPFLTRTKTEVVRLIAEAGCGDLLRYTTSCQHTWVQTKQHPHCGECSQCIDRRYAVLAAGQEANDPAGAYRVDLVEGERTDGRSRTLLAVYTETANQVSAYSATSFFGRFGEVARALRYLDGPPDAAALWVYDLYRRHASDVTRVVDQTIRERASSLRQRTISPNNLIGMVLDLGGGSTDQPQSDVALTILGRPLPDNLITQRGQAWVVRYAAGKDFLMLPSRGMAYLQILLSRPGVTMSAAELAAQVARVPQEFMLGDAEERLDRDARTAYRARYDELNFAIEEARARRNDEEVERVLEEMTWLTNELGGSSGLNGRPRRDSSIRNRVRNAVGNAIRRAVEGIHPHDEALAEHLCPPQLCCGHTLCYRAEQSVRWQTDI
jgi:7-cyano-7-deazaguanine synthase in queuosine biosynthesis